MIMRVLLSGLISIVAFFVTLFFMLQREHYVCACIGCPCATPSYTLDYTVSIIVLIVVFVGIYSLSKPKSN